MSGIIENESGDASTSKLKQLEEELAELKQMLKVVTSKPPPRTADEKRVIEWCKMMNLPDPDEADIKFYVSRMVLIRKFKEKDNL